MAIFISLKSQFTSPLANFVTMAIFLFHISLKGYATPLNFSYTSFDTYSPEIVRERDTMVSNEGIELTINLSDKRKQGSIGRATYKEPLHLWDKKSGNLTNFTTHFSFIVNSRGSSYYGDGLAFFLAPNGSLIDPQVKSGGGLALAVNDSVEEALNFEENHFVAVEFDTFCFNDWDPEYEHVGINIRSMKSDVAVPWQSNVKEGRKTDAWINYDSWNHNLSVSFTYVHFKNSSVMHGSASAVVDLAKYLPEWVTFGFSASTGEYYEVNRITGWEFNSSSDIMDHVRDLIIAPAPSPVLTKNRESNKTGLVVGLSLTACSLITGLSFILYRLRRKPRKEVITDDPVFSVSFGEDFKNGTGPRKFSYDELADATKYFSEEKKLGKGGFGAVYRGFLKDLNCYVAVKRISKESKQGIKEYAAEVKIISRMRHRNLVKLIGWCHEKELLLAYEFMPNGSLDNHLFKGKSLLTWEIRYRIAQGLASALLYLHEEGDQCVLHRDIKSSNIMLDSNFEAKLGDFGLARLVDHAKGTQTTVVAGTMGYMAPECFTTGKASKESDIFSFGVVALEIACGRRVVEPRLEEDQTRIVEWAWELHGRGKLLEASDPKLCGNFNIPEMERLLIVGLWCVHPDRRSRPSIRQVINVLITCEAALPVLPPEMPEPAYISPPLKLFISSNGFGSSNQKPTEISSYNYANNSSEPTSSSAASSPSASHLLCAQ